MGNPDEYTIKQLAETICELTGSGLKLIYQDLPPDDPTRRKPDITLAKQHLGWEPTIPLREGLQKTIEWFKTIHIEDYRPPTPNF
jgi:UDP-glucuronate decarboxylase